MLAWGRASFPQAAIPEGGIVPPIPRARPLPSLDFTDSGNLAALAQAHLDSTIPARGRARADGGDPEGGIDSSLFASVRPRPNEDELGAFRQLGSAQTGRKQQVRGTAGSSAGTYALIRIGAPCFLPIDGVERINSISLEGGRFHSRLRSLLHGGMTPKN